MVMACQQNDLMLNTIQVLDEEKETILSEILKCAICLEFPRGKQVRICEEGHHFCLTCHKKLKFCGICRGKLLESRNFVVEELVTKLGPILGTPEGELPLPAAPEKYTPGSYHCPHPCPAKTPSHLMLSHLRTRHADHLLDNVRSNPYSGQFSFVLDVSFTPDKEHAWSAQVSDMGLFTVVVNLVGLDIYGWAKALGNRSLASRFKYQLVVKAPSKHGHFEFGAGDLEVASYLEEKPAILRRGNFLKVKGSDLEEHVSVGEKLTLFFSVWRKDQKRKGHIPAAAFFPEKHLFFPNDRGTRRNRNRNMRRKRLKEKIRSSSAENKAEALAEGISRLEL